MEIRDTKRLLRIVGFGLLLTAAVILRPNGSRASDVGFRVGYMFDAEALSVGMEYLNSLDNSNEWFFNPNVELGMGDERNVAAFNGDFHYDFDTQSPFAQVKGILSDNSDLALAVGIRF